MASENVQLRRLVSISSSERDNGPSGGGERATSDNRTTELNGERRESRVAVGRGNEQSPVSGDNLLRRALAGFTGEFVGTFILTLCIITAVASSVITGALSGLWQVAVLCGLGVSLGIYVSAHISGEAHLNPAVTLAIAVFRFKDFSWKNVAGSSGPSVKCGLALALGLAFRVAVYIMAQMLGSFAAGAVQYGLYGNAICAFEEDRGIERGTNGSELSAMVFGEYFPNPALFPDSRSITSPIEAAVIEGWATGILVFVIFALTDPSNTTVGSREHKVAVPILIGATVMVLVSLYGPLTQAGLNPARDFGPRAFAAAVGWGRIAIPGPRGGFWAYIAGPLVGGLLGGALYDLGAANVRRIKKCSCRLNSKSTI